MSTITYLTRRGGGVYYLQCRVRLFSGRKRLLRISLGVKDHRTAKEMLYSYLRWLLPMQTVLDARILFDEIDSHGRSLILKGPATDYGSVKLRYHFVKEAWLGITDWMASNPSPVTDYDLFERCTKIRLVLVFIHEMIKEDSAHLDIPPWPVPQANASDLGYFAERSGPFFLCVNKLDGRVREIAPPGNYDPEIFINIPPSEARLRANEATIFDLYYDENGKRIVGRPLGELKDDHAARFNSCFSKAQDDSASLYTRYAYAQRHGLGSLKMLSRARYATYHRCMQQFFGWMKLKGFADIAFKFNLVPKGALESGDRQAWENEDMLRFFSLPLFTGCESKEHFWTKGNNLIQNELYWAYVIIFFTGMRNSEIGKLRCANIIREGNIWFFDLTKTIVKTKAARRLIPIPVLLTDLGLLDRKADLEAANVAPLFPEWKHFTNRKSGRSMDGHHLSKSWQYVKKKFEFDHEELTIYGGRHTRAGWYDQLKLPERLRNMALGHSPKTVANNYGGKKMSLDEARVILSETLPIEAQIASILITAKLRAMVDELKDEEKLNPIRTW